MVILSLKVCVAEFMLSDTVGTGFAMSWFPTLVAESLVASTKDGTVDNSPDAVTFIDADLTWTNGGDDPVHLMMAVRRASRTLVTSNPNKVVLDDAYSWDIATSPAAPRPTATRNGVGIMAKISPALASTLQFGHLFGDRADWIHYEEIGQCDPGLTLQFRYMCLFSTPGTWRTAITPKHEAWARYVQLRLFAAPMVTGAI